MYVYVKEREREREGEREREDERGYKTMECRVLSVVVKKQYHPYLIDAFIIIAIVNHCREIPTT